jgi:hypothetical protein
LVVLWHALTRVSLAGYANWLTPTATFAAPNINKELTFEGDPEHWAASKTILLVNGRLKADARNSNGLTAR